MLLSGFTFIRNALKYDFPITECVESMLPIVDELVINVGKSDDGTEKLMEQLASRWPKLRLIHSVWDDSKTDRGLVLSEQTNIALQACRGRWALYLQADEALHESEHASIRSAVEQADRESAPVDGLRFRYLHFYGGYSLVQRPWNWYPSEIRIVRCDSGARSFGDAQTFRIGDAELRTKLLDAHVFHYGHARAPEMMKNKISYFHRFWHGDNHGIKVDQAYNLEWKNLVWYWGTHPTCYERRVKAGYIWTPTPEKANPSLEHLVIQNDAATSALGDEIATLAKRIRPSLELTRVLSINDALRAPAGATLLDLCAETRGAIEFAAWALAIGNRFKARIAHSPNGTLSRVRQKLYTHVNWGAHETRDQGFNVPKAEQARQLLRWAGINL